MTVQTQCAGRRGLPKKRYESERAVRRELARKHAWRNRRWPRIYACPDCKGYHLTAGTP